MVDLEQKAISWLKIPLTNGYSKLLHWIELSKNWSKKKPITQG